MSQANKELMRMGDTVDTFYSNAIKFFFNPKDKEINPLFLEQTEELINRLEEQITNYVVKVTSENRLTEEQSNSASILLHAVNDLERIGDHADNIVELTIYGMECKISFSHEALESLRTMAELTSSTVELSLQALMEQNHELARNVIKNEAIIDSLERQFREGHIQRLNEQECVGVCGSVFLDMLGNMERVGDHAANLAEYVLGETGTIERRHAKYKAT